MIEFLLSSSMICIDARNLISRIEQQRDYLGNRVVNGLVPEVKTYVPECFNEGSVHNR